MKQESTASNNDKRLNCQLQRKYAGGRIGRKSIKMAILPVSHMFKR